MTAPSASPPAAPASETPPVQHWRYPFPTQKHGEAVSPQPLYEAAAQRDGGYFPLGVNGFPHGGVHLGPECARAFDVAGGVRCLADGEIVAYKLDDTYPHLRFTQDDHWAMYATGFVLVRHVLALPPLPGDHAARGDTQTLYSLYMHMADWSTYLADGVLKRPGWWIGVEAFRIGSADRQDGGDAPGARVRTAPTVGAHGREIAGQVVGFLPEGSEVRIGETRGAWGHIASITAGTMISPVSGSVFGDDDDQNGPWCPPGGDASAPVTPKGDWGWIFLHDQQAVTEPTGVGRVVIPPQPIPVNAGTLLGQLGEYIDYARSSPLPPVPTRQLLHLEVFAGAEFAAFLDASRTRAASLPVDQKTVLVVHAGARLLTDVPPPDRHLADLYPTHFGVARPTADSPAEGPWIKVQPMYGEPWGLQEHAPDGGPVWIERDQLKDAKATTPAWSQYPLQLTAANGPPSTFARIVTRGELDALEDGDRALDEKGQPWWRLLVETGDGRPRTGWVGQHHPNTAWESPWAWPGFELVDATDLALTDAFQRNLVVTGSADGSEAHTFKEAMARVDGSPLFQRLAQTLRHAVKRDASGKAMPATYPVNAVALRDAMRVPWLASDLSHLILRYESEWGGNMARWEAITPLMRNARENWECELQRIHKLQWWNEVRGKIEGFPDSPVVYHIHPIALVANFMRPPFAFTLAMMQGLFPKATDTNLQAMVEELNAHLDLYHLDTPLRRAHFFAQVMQETGSALTVEEGFVWKADLLVTTFDYFAQHPSEATTYGYSSPTPRPQPIKADGHPMTHSDFVAIANRAYEKRFGNGVAATGDGWRYRGRGLIHLTFHDNYAAFTAWHRAHQDAWPQDAPDFVAQPDLVTQVRYAVRSAAYFWVTHALYAKADVGPTEAVVNAITRIVNLKTPPQSYDQRRTNFNRIWDKGTFQ